MDRRGGEKEAEQRGMSWTQVGMKRYIDKFYRQRQKTVSSPRAGGGKKSVHES